MLQILVIALAALYVEADVPVEGIAVEYAQARHRPRIVRQPVVSAEGMRLGRRGKAPAVGHETLRTVALHTGRPLVVDVHMHVALAAYHVRALRPAGDVCGNHLSAARRGAYAAVLSFHVATYIIRCIAEIARRSPVIAVRRCHHRTAGKRKRTSSAIVQAQRRSLPERHRERVVHHAALCNAHKQILRGVVAEGIAEERSDGT